MTVAELIQALELVEDKTQRVVVRGYEGGYNDVNELESLQIYLDYYFEWFYGKHESDEVVRSNNTKVPAIHLSA